MIVTDNDWAIYNLIDSFALQRTCDNNSLYETMHSYLPHWGTEDSITFNIICRTVHFIVYENIFCNMQV